MIAISFSRGSSQLQDWTYVSCVSCIGMQILYHCPSWTVQLEAPSWILTGTKDFVNKAREFHKNIYFCFIDYAKAFDCVAHNKLENSSTDGNTRAPDLPPEKTYMQVRKQQLELDMEQQTGSK